MNIGRHSQSQLSSCSGLSQDNVPGHRRPGDVLCIVGPTGSGKSALALRLAQELNGEIVNCDSVQLYRGFDIGTAKPQPAERTVLPHHLIDVAGPDIEYSAGDFARQATDLLLLLCDRQKLPVVAGGTGFYLKALMDGLVPAPGRDPEIRNRLELIETRKPGRLHRLLTRLDPLSARNIAPADTRKLVRALEVILLRGQPLSSLYREQRLAPQSLRFFQIGLNPPRDQLYRRLDQRCLRMWQNGLLLEAESLLQMRYPRQARAFGAIGYKQALQVLDGHLDEATALAEMQRDTRRYAKRQWTWFRRDPRVFWIPGFGDDRNTHKHVVVSLYKRMFWY